jgi:hypothetical protein
LLASANLETMPPRVRWEYTLATSRLVQSAAALAGGSFGSILVAAVLARVHSGLGEPAALAGFLGCCVVVLASVLLVREHGVSRRLGAVGGLVAVLVGGALYRVALVGPAVAAGSVVLTLQVALGMAWLATVARSSGSVGGEELRYGDGVAVALDRVSAVRAVSFHRRALVWFAYDDGAPLLDPATPRLVVVSADAVPTIRRIAE